VKVSARAASVLFAAWIAAAALTAGAGQGTVFRWNIPAWAAPPVVPADNPMSVEKVALGRYLFYDKRLSYNQKLSCAGCHIQRFGFTDLSPTAFGSTGERHPRRVATLTNVAYNAVLTWANPTQRRLETQMLTPMFGEHPVELGLAGREKVLLERLRADPRYQSLFTAAFPDAPDPFTLGSVTKAIATFERTLLSFSSPYDRYRYGGDGAAIGESAKRGEALFFGDKLDCFHCHSGVNFSDNGTAARTRLGPMTFHNTGLYNVDGRYPASNPGVREFTGDPRDDGAFKTPTLRNVAVRAPYMHDGSVIDLNAVLDHYSAGGRTIVGTPLAGIGRLNPNKDVAVKGFALSERERRDLIAFLQSLTDTAFLTDPALSDPFAASPAPAPNSSRGPETPR
jgi:cytochrome c peroxidase